jgi:D-sedoheptulose 7-phosphate isomerase
MKTLEKHLSEVSEAMTLLDLDEVRKMCRILKQVRLYDGTVYLFGNGGSHTTAAHFANDLMKIAKVRAVCVGEMSGAMLAYGNDHGWENMFSDPLGEMLRENDGVVGISCSGNSENVLMGLSNAMSQNILTVGMTGPSSDSKVNKLGLDSIVHVMAEDIRVQEDLHVMVCHAVVRIMNSGEEND